MDLSATGRRAPMTMREVVGLPLRVARERHRHVVVFFDELQRAVDYADGDQASSWSTAATNAAFRRWRVRDSNRGHYDFQRYL